ncbi:MAG: hypothetical protein KVP17_000332 [Porospora cf. gigantea B]|uniref:uncharacterized protein n=1 Tax=Porospora cf. gigantea B TaxID=2853592 RepID=UPI003571F9E1|nr:MAG: hypothetical protein KVP17_000332 [Porospora cf. gigantea B]
MTGPGQLPNLDFLTGLMSALGTGNADAGAPGVDASTATATNILKRGLPAIAAPAPIKPSNGDQFEFQDLLKLLMVNQSAQRGKTEEEKAQEMTQDYGEAVQHLLESTETETSLAEDALHEDPTDLTEDELYEGPTNLTEDAFHEVPTNLTDDALNEGPTNLKEEELHEAPTQPPAETDDAVVPAALARLKTVSDEIGSLFESTSKRSLSTLEARTALKGLETCQSGLREAEGRVLDACHTPAKSPITSLSCSQAGWAQAASNTLTPGIPIVTTVGDFKMVAVIHGHGGGLLAKALSGLLEVYLTQALSTVDADESQKPAAMVSSIKSAIRDLDIDLNHQPLFYQQGAVLAFALVNDKYIVCGNCGNATTFLVFKDGLSARLSTEHTLANPCERNRLEPKKADIIPTESELVLDPEIESPPCKVSKPRWAPEGWFRSEVKHGRLGGMFTSTRALGYYRHKKDPQDLLSSEVDIKVCLRQPSDSAIVIVSDGVASWLTADNLVRCLDPSLSCEEQARRVVSRAKAQAAINREVGDSKTTAEESTCVVLDLNAIPRAP